MGSAVIDGVGLTVGDGVKVAGVRETDVAVGAGDGDGVGRGSKAPDMTKKPATATTATAATVTTTPRIIPGNDRIRSLTAPAGARRNQPDAGSTAAPRLGA